MTEGKKHQISKKTGPVQKDVDLHDVIKTKVQEDDQDVREELKTILHDHKDFFPHKLPCGPWHS